MKVEIADTFWKKFAGIMFRGEHRHLMLFPLEKETRTGAAIHSFFCPPFDVLWLDSNKKVVDLRKDIGPWNPNLMPKKECFYILEAPVGYIRNKKIKIGTKLKL